MTILRCTGSLLALLVGFIRPADAQRPPALTDNTAHAESAIHQAEYGKLPVYFEENAGQTDPSVRFLARGVGYALFITDTGTVAVLSRHAPAIPAAAEAKRRLRSDASHAQRTALRMSLVAANERPVAHGEELLEGKSNYFIGNDPSKWRTSIAQYGKVRLAEVYPGIDVVYYGSGTQLEYDFVVRPGGDPRQIRLQFDGAEQIEVDKGGDLLLHVDGGVVRQQLPAVYQEVNGVRQQVRATYRRLGEHQFGVNLALYDPARPLIIDPVLAFSTYLGGMGVDSGSDIVVDSSGSASIIGVTESSDFPTTTGTLQGTSGGGFDVVVSKLNAAGSALTFSTYLGGSGDDFGESIAMDGAGNLYLAGETSSSDFPTTAGAFQRSYGGHTDAFVAKLSPTGSELGWSTYLGAEGNDEGIGIAVDGSGTVTVIGDTDSSHFPVTLGAQQSSNAGGFDAFATRLNATGSALIWSTYFGGSVDDEASDVALDGLGNLYVAGETDSVDFPTLHPVQGTSGGGFDAFVTKLSAAGSTIYSTYLGGSKDDEAFAIAVSSTGNAYVSGTSLSIDFPVVHAVQGTTGGIDDGIVAKLSVDGSSLVWSTYLGGSDSDFTGRITLDSEGNAWVMGFTASTDFPATPNALQRSSGGGADAYIARLSADGAILAYASYLGGSNNDYGNGIVLDSAGDLYVLGSTSSTDFPIRGAAQGTYHGNQDVFITKFSALSTPRHRAISHD